MRAWTGSWKGKRDVLFCALLGGLAFLLVYGPDSLHVTYDTWILNGYVEEDIIQHYTGWMAFRESPFAFPLGLTDRLGYPEGLVISFTDSLPLVSLFFKCLSGILPETFQFFGWYVLGCFVLQGAFSALLTGLFTKNRWGIYGSCILFVFSPILLERAFRHTALASQWLILAALYLYFRAKKNGGTPRGFLLLSVLCVGIHPYFLPMILGILAAWTLERFGEGKKGALLFLLGNLAAAVLAGYLLGIFGSGVSGTAGGFGYYSMNLNALWNPSSLGMETWSALLPVQDQIYGNYEGFNYLGAGVLLFAGMGILGKTAGLLREKRLRQFVKCYAGLLLFFGFCVLFAVSHVVTFGDRELFRLPLPETLEQLCSVFRAGGRMFWPVYEMLFLTAVLTAVSLPGFIRSLSGRDGAESVECERKRKLLYQAGSVAALAILLGIQLYDLSPALAEKHGSIDAEHLEAGSYDPAFYHSEDWAQVLGAYERAELLNYHHDYNLAAFLMKNHVKSNILPANRGDFAEAEARCEEMIRALYEGSSMEEGVVYLTNDPLLASQLSWNLNEELIAYDLGAYTAFGRRTEGVTAKEAVFAGEKDCFAAIEEGSADWNYLRERKGKELVFPATVILEWELSRAQTLQLGEAQTEILGYEVYSNEYIRDYIYVKCAADTDLPVFEHAEEIRLK